MDGGLALYLAACTPQMEPMAPEDEWIPLREAARGTPYSQEYLSLLARKGRLEAIKRGRVWTTTRRAVDAYRRSVSGEKEMGSVSIRAWLAPVLIRDLKAVEGTGLVCLGRS